MEFRRLLFRSKCIYRVGLAIGLNSSSKPFVEPSNSLTITSTPRSDNCVGACGAHSQIGTTRTLNPRKLLRAVGDVLHPHPECRERFARVGAAGSGPTGRWDESRVGKEGV